MTIETRVLSLAQRAQIAWAAKQHQQAKFRAEQIERQRTALREAVQALVRSALLIDGVADVQLIGDDERWLYHPQRCSAEFTVDGERFEVLLTDEGWALFHQWTCPTCGTDGRVLTTLANHIESLADLGFWLEHAPTLCHCAHGGDDGAP